MRENEFLKNGSQSSYNHPLGFGKVKCYEEDKIGYPGCQGLFS